MSEPYIGEIRAFGFGFYPVGWLPCNGTPLPISQNTPLFAVIGTSYGGDGQTTFNLPNLNGTAMLGTGQGPGLSNYQLGEQAGTAGVTLIESEMPPHNHTVTGINAKAADVYAAPIADISRLSRASTPTGVCNAYSDQAANATLAPQALAPFPGQSGSHENRQPCLTVYYAIASEGVFPTPP